MDIEETPASSSGAENMDMAQILAEQPEIKEGQIVRGQVLQIEDDRVIVDIGYKCEGYIPKREFLDVDGTLTVQIGDEVDVAVDRLGTSQVRLSKRNVDQARIWQQLEEKAKKKEPVKGRVLKRIKGGFRVDLGGTSAFLPYSQASLEKHPKEETFEGFLDQVFYFHVSQVDAAHRNVVLTRRPLLEEERRQQRKEFLSALKEGEIREGTVKSVTDYGAFVDLGVMDGLLHITDLDWCRVQKVEDVVKPGDKVRVMVLQVDVEREKISLGLKQTKPDPWKDAETRYPVGSVVTVEPVHWVDYGVFFKTPEGLEGFCHLKEISWSKQQKDLKQILPPGSSHQAVVLEIKPEKRKMLLSLKRTRPSPWETAAQKWRVGQNVQVKVVSRADFGLFCELEEGLEGLLHATDVTWDRSRKNPHEAYSVGDTLTVQILSLEPEKKRLSFGLKQVEGDPWVKAAEALKVGEKIAAKVTRVVEYGVFLEAQPYVEGLLHMKEMGKKIGNLKDAFPEGSEHEVYVLSFEPQKKRLAFTLRESAFRGPDDPDRVSKATKSFGRLWKKFLKMAKEGTAD